MNNKSTKPDTKTELSFSLWSFYPKINQSLMNQIDATQRVFEIEL